MEKPTVLQSSSTHDLLDDLSLEILSRLPVKSLLRFRCVSRSWKSWIDHPDFTRLHLHRFNNRPHDPQILFVYGSQCVLKNSNNLTPISSLGFLQSDPGSHHILRSTPASNPSAVRRWLLVSSTDGLFLLRSGYHLMLWNPAIRKTLPLPPFPAQELHRLVNFGLGFDPLIREYKVVRFGFLRSRVVFAAVFTLKTTNSWKMIDPPLAGSQCWESSIHFNGVLYGIARLEEHMKLVSFDFSTEVFDSFDFPKTDFSMGYLTIMDDGSSLALICMRQPYGSIWVLEGVGDDTATPSWIQRYAFDTVYPSRIQRNVFGTVYSQRLFDYSFLSVKNGEMLMKWNDIVVCYNLETEQKKFFLEKTEGNCEMANMVTYMESLVLHN